MTTESEKFPEDPTQEEVDAAIRSASQDMGESYAGEATDTKVNEVLRSVAESSGEKFEPELGQKTDLQIIAEQEEQGFRFDGRYGQEKLQSFEKKRQESARVFIKSAINGMFLCFVPKKSPSELEEEGNVY